MTSTNESVIPILEIDAQSKKLAYFLYHQLYLILKFAQLRGQKQNLFLIFSSRFSDLKFFYHQLYLILNFFSLNLRKSLRHHRKFYTENLRSLLLPKLGSYLLPHKHEDSANETGYALQSETMQLTIVFQMIFFGLTGQLLHGQLVAVMFIHIFCIVQHYAELICHLSHTYSSSSILSKGLYKLGRGQYILQRATRM